jgi:hypothetical protein
MLKYKRGYSPCIGRDGWPVDGSPGEENRITYVYIITDTIHTKVGVSYDPEKRRQTLQTSCPLRLEIFHQEAFCDRASAFSFEKAVRARFIYCGASGGDEWFLVSAAEMKAYLVALLQEEAKIAEKAEALVAEAQAQVVARKAKLDRERGAALFWARFHKKNPEWAERRRRNNYDEAA